MRGLILVLALAIPAIAGADGDPKSLAPVAPPPPVVDAKPIAPPMPVVEPAAPEPVAEAGPGPVAAAPVRSEGFGSDTRYWLASQISGNQSVTELRPIAGEVAQRNYDRYLKSFEYAIPETFKRESFGTGGGTSTR